MPDPYLPLRDMDLENDPEFWKWLVEQQKYQNDQEDTFKPLVLELPLPPREWEEKRPKDPQEDSPDTHNDEFVIFEL